MCRADGSRPTSSARATGISEFYDDGEVPGRFAANLTVGFTVPNINLNVKASATNLFDTETPDVLGAPETGRLLWVSATYKFQGLNF